MPEEICSACGVVKYILTAVIAFLPSEHVYVIARTALVCNATLRPSDVSSSLDDTQVRGSKWEGRSEGKNGGVAIKGSESTIGGLERTQHQAVAWCQAVRGCSSRTQGLCLSCQVAFGVPLGSPLQG